MKLHEPQNYRAWAIEIHELRFQYRPSGFSLHVPQLRIHTGERVALIGPSGAGKTTLAHLMAGILTPSQGRIRVLGHDLESTPDARRRELRITTMGLVFQDLKLLDYLTARENILLPYRVSPALNLDRTVQDRVEDLARTVGIHDRLDAPPAQLSGGEKQRVALCRALITKPALVLADEPTGSLDPGTTRQVLDHVLAAVAAVEGTLVLVTHQPESLEGFDRVLTVAEGAVTGPEPTEVMP